VGGNDHRPRANRPLRTTATPPGGRFVYLSWGTVDDAGHFTLFRRAKLMLEDVPTDVLDSAARSGLLVGSLGLTDAKGNPLCARVRPPQISWTAA
jgi:Family of unknown function (DUF5990)